MTPVLQSLSIIVVALYMVYMLTVMTRFSIVTQRISVFNPIYNAFYQLSSKPIGYIEKILPKRKSKVDWGALIYAYLVSVAVAFGMSLVAGIITPYVLVWGLIILLSAAQTLIFFVVILIILASWIAPATDNPALTLLRQAVSPLIDVFRKVIPPFGGLDISPIFLMITLGVFEALILTPLKAHFYFPPFLMMF